MLRSLVLLCAGFLPYFTPLATADWLRFRGPNGSGVSTDPQPAPTTWSPESNLKWKTPLPGPGVSSPIVVGDRVFVTCYSGYGVDRRETGSIEDLHRHLVCLDGQTGQILWERKVKAALPEDPFSGMGVPSHGYASHTPVSDGKQVFVFFGKSGVFAYDMDGNQQWQAEVGKESDRRRWGSSSSPIIHEGLVIVTASAESESLIGLDKATGKQVWRQETAGVADVWGTPVLAKIDENRTDLVLGVPYEIWGLNPASGKLRWYSEATGSDQYSSSVVEANGVIYGIEGRGGGSVAVKAGGKGDVAKSNTLWTGRDNSRFGTPLVVNDQIYYFSNGIANSIRCDNGESVFQTRMPAAGGEPGADTRPRGGRGFGGSQSYSSPVAAGKTIYYVDSNGTCFVLEAGAKFKLLATNRFTTDREVFSSTPAISGGNIYVRSDKTLYCVGE